MKEFLADLAEQIYRDHPSLDDLTIVFPNRRAIIYFRKHLSALLQKPAFAPRFLTIEDFIGTFSLWQVPDKLELVHRLYKSYYEVLGNRKEDEALSPEPFDKFYFWGDMLLRDFDEVDKYMVNATQLFKDLSSQKELDASFDFLTPEQTAFLRSFWGNFDADLTANKQKFLHVWRLLPEVYLAFRKQLKDENLAYEGMLHRSVAETLEFSLPAKREGKLIFAGFNALTIAEERIISLFVDQDEAKVYWDLDQYYVNDNTQEAGKFFRQYQEHSVLKKTFPQNLPGNFKTAKSVRIVGAAQHVGQTKLMTQFIKEQLEKGINPEETLIVLPDEKLLLPVLHGISGYVEKLNVTMGFPLASTPMFNLIEFLIELQINRRAPYFNHRQVLSLLGHPYVLAADPVLANERRKEIIQNNRIVIHQSELTAGPALYPMMFTFIGEGGLTRYLHDIIASLGALQGLAVLDKEYAFHFLKLINRFEEVTGVGGDVLQAEENVEKRFQAELKSFSRLFRQLVRAQRIPFTGEPLKGLQVMGVLETRNLDYKNVFVLSLNEGALPASGNKPSYIPYNIRKAYSLPTAEHQDAFYAYLFYRVLQRAENIFLFYNTETDVLGQGEMSRYLQQILFESGWQPQHDVLHNTIQPHAILPIEIKKDETVLKNLTKLNDGNPRFKGISPSALNTYIECQLQFYFKHIAKIREADEVEEDLDARLVGNLLHDVMERYYRKIQDHKKSNFIEASDLTHHGPVVEQLIDEVFIENYSLDRDKVVTYEGQRLVVREVIKSFVERIIKRDQDYAPFSIEGLEHSGLLYYLAIVHAPGQAVIGGKIDRLDRKGDVVRVIDYKTGRDKLDFESVESLFNREGKRNKAAFQTLVYALLYQSNYPEKGVRIAPGLINRLNIFDDKYGFELTINKQAVKDAGPLLKEMEVHLKILLEELFNPAETFKQTLNTENCKYCPYQGICYR